MGGREGERGRREGGGEGGEGGGGGGGGEVHTFPEVASIFNTHCITHQ